MEELKELEEAFENIKDGEINQEVLEKMELEEGRIYEAQKRNARLTFAYQKINDCYGKAS